MQCKLHCFKISFSYNDLRVIKKKQVRSMRGREEGRTLGWPLPASFQQGWACGVYLGNVPLHVLRSSAWVPLSKASFLFLPVRCTHRVNRKALVNQICAIKKSVRTL